MSLSYQEFKDQVSKLCGIDLSSYKSKQLDRRIHSLMSLWRVKDYDDYLHILKTDAQRYQEFLKKLTINVSEFFRNPESFIYLWEKVLPELLKTKEVLKIWSAGCAGGAEPCSIGIILKELDSFHRAQILATDIDAQILVRAKEAFYTANEVKSLPRELLAKYFREEKNYYYLNPEIKKIVRFQCHDLLADPFPAGFDLIVCRNVVIYFAEEVKNGLYVKFNRSLRMGGYLLVGGTEPLLNYYQLGFENVSYSFYKKVKDLEEKEIPSH